MLATALQSEKAVSEDKEYNTEQGDEDRDEREKGKGED